MAIELPKDTKVRLLASIKRFSQEELESDFGDLKAGLVLDFCLKEIGPSIYNQAIADAQAFLLDKAEDLPAQRHEDEFGYWKR